MVALSSTTSAITTGVSHSRVTTKLTTAAISRMMISRSWNWRRNARHRGSRRASARRFGPSRSSRRAASPEDSPSPASTSSRCITSAAGKGMCGGSLGGGSCHALHPHRVVDGGANRVWVQYAGEGSADHTGCAAARGLGAAGVECRRSDRHPARAGRVCAARRRRRAAVRRSGCEPPWSSGVHLLGESITDCGPGRRRSARPCPGPLRMRMSTSPNASRAAASSRPSPVGSVTSASTPTALGSSPAICRARSPRRPERR